MIINSGAYMHCSTVAGCQRVHRLLVLRTLQNRSIGALLYPGTPFSHNLQNWLAFAKQHPLSLYIPQLTMSTPTQAIEAIHVLTQKAQALQAPAQHINQIHGTLMVIGQGPFPQILAGLREIVTIAAADVQQMMNMKAVAAGSESSMMFDAYRAVSRSC